MYFNDDNLSILTTVDSYSWNWHYADNVVSSVNDNTWRHIVWTIDSSGNWAIYLSGVSYWTASDYCIPKSITRSSNFVGKSNFDGEPYYNGNIDDFGMYNSVLTVTDVFNIYSSANDIPTFLPSKAPSRMCI